jgi:hypothetical protein
LSGGADLLDGSFGGEPQIAVAGSLETFGVK